MMDLKTYDRDQFNALMAAADAQQHFKLSGAGTDTWYRPRGVSSGSDYRGPFLRLTFEQLSETVNTPSPDPAIWNGPEDGLPPVGLEVEIRLRNKPDWSNWCSAKILFCKDSALVFEWAAEGVAHPVNLEQCEIRQIRTAEQLGAEKREADAQAMYESIYFAEPKGAWQNLPENSRETFRKAIDKGWQQVKP